MQDDPELRDGLRCDLHSLRARDTELDALCAEIQQVASARAAANFSKTSEISALRQLVEEKPILITGSAGYLGAALHLTLKQLDFAVVGIDLTPAATVDAIADVADLQAISRYGRLCGAVLHTAALHAPHASAWHAREFAATNITGTNHILSLGLPTVHTSTTSLTITKRVKEREKSGELVWLDEHAQTGPELESSTYDPSLDAPRNKYGRTKLAGEQRCLASAKAGGEVCVLRAPRFFAEDVLEEGVTLSLPNIKANELLGRRCALVDLLDAELRALARIRQPSVRGSVLTIAAPWPLERAPLISSRDAAALIRTHYPQADDLFAQHGFRLPDEVSRVYDCEAACKALDWQPRVTFEALLRTMEQHQADVTVREGLGGRREQPKKRAREDHEQDSPALLPFEALLRGAF